MTDTNSTKGRPPASYKQASLRNVTPVNSGRIGIGFDVEGGEPLRVSIPVSDIGPLARLLDDYLHLCHSEMLSGMPSSDVSSTPLTENKVVTLKPEFGQFDAALADLTRYAQELSEFEVAKPFFQRLHALICADDFINHFFRFDSHTASASEVVVTLEPTELFRKILATLRAGDFDLSIFEV